MTSRTGFAVAAAVGIVLGAVAADTALYESHAPPDARAASAVVLGAAVWGDEPSPVFAARLDHAAALYLEERVERIALTGGTRAPDVRTESGVGRDYLLGLGIPDSALVLEERSTTTWQNLACIRPVLEGDAVLVSDPLHLRRAVAMARDLGIDARPAATPTSRYRSLRARAGFLVRETYFRVANAVAALVDARGGCPS